ncbi:MAG: class I SAM-dependent methyltransferase [Candidatus Sulfotelmatobacter sp.]
MSELDFTTAVPWTMTSNLRDAMNLVRDRFPFPQCLDRQIPGCMNTCQAIMRHLPASTTTRILDFGCGAGEKAALLSALGYQCSAYDDLADDWHKMPGNREAIENFAAAMGIDFKLAGGGSQFPWGPRTFDLVMLNDVIEHLHNSPRTLVNSLLQLLKENGLLLITVPNAVNIRKRIAVLFGRTNLQNFKLYFWYPDPWRGHIREYTKGDLQSLSEYLGLKIVEMRSCDQMLGRVPAPFRPPYLAVTGVFRGWKDSWLLIARKEKGWKPREMTRDELSHLFSGFGAGAYPSETGGRRANSAR